MTVTCSRHSPCAATLARGPPSRPRPARVRAPRASARVLVVVAAAPERPHGQTREREREREGKRASEGADECVYFSAVMMVRELQIPEDDAGGRPPAMAAGVHQSPRSPLSEVKNRGAACGRGGDAKSKLARHTTRQQLIQNRF